MQSFDNLQSTGLTKIPLNGIVQIEDGINGFPLYFTLVETTNIASNPTLSVLQFLVNFPGDWAIIGSNINHTWDEVRNILTVEI